MKLKNAEEILTKILYKYFMDDFVNAKLCASDNIYWYSRDKDHLKGMFEEWLIDNGYADPVTDKQ